MAHFLGLEHIFAAALRRDAGRFLVLILRPASPPRFSWAGSAGLRRPLLTHFAFRFDIKPVAHCASHVVVARRTLHDARCTLLACVVRCAWHDARRTLHVARRLLRATPCARCVSPLRIARRPSRVARGKLQGPQAGPRALLTWWTFNGRFGHIFAHFADQSLDSTSRVRIRCRLPSASVRKTWTI